MNFHTLVNERNEWIAHNFPGDTLEDSILGIIEELGEFTHHFLKMRQRVRGQDPFHRAEMKDAVGDMTIFLLGVMSRCGVPTAQDIRGEGRELHERPTEETVFSLAYAVGRLGTQVSVNRLRLSCGRIVNLLHIICERYNWDYDQIVQETWDAVKQRDWVLYPETGLPPRPTVESQWDNHDMHMEANRKFREHGEEGGVMADERERRATEFITTPERRGRPRLHLGPDGLTLSIGFELTNDTLLRLGGGPAAVYSPEVDRDRGDMLALREWVAAVNAVIERDSSVPPPTLPQRLLAQTQEFHNRLSDEAAAIEEQLGHLSARLREIDFMRSATAEVLGILSSTPPEQAEAR